MTSNIFHFSFVVALHVPTVRRVLVIAQGNFRLGDCTFTAPDDDPR